MCGICGFVKTNGKIEENAIKKMLAPLRHRGPDDKGIFLDNGRSACCGLGHRRLSIIDLERGHQPLRDAEGANICVHNGEIYNFPDLKKELEQKGYAFRTKSDAEVIANMYHASGKECLRHFNGMFAFAIWNKSERSLFMARDRVGIKPLYYYHDAENFLFSSSLKSFLAFDFLKKEIDTEALSEYLRYLYVNAPRTIFKSVRKLEPGSALSFKNGKVTIEKYWSAKDLAKKRKNRFITGEKEAACEIKRILSDSVRMRLISDVPLGIFLSGGVDSSIITALASGHSTGKIKTFSITFKGKGYYDESGFAKKISGIFGTEHSEIEVSPDLKKDLPEIINLLDEPFADSSYIPAYYLSAFTRHRVKVALSGTGGDDIFAGYRRYAADKAINIFDRSPTFIKKGVSTVVKSIPPTRKNRIGEKALLARRFFSVLNIEKEKRHEAIMTFVNTDMQAEILKSRAISANSRGILTGISESFKDEPYVNRSLYTDFLSYLSGDLLKKEDAATMAVGLEGRVPFLDHRLVEYSFRIDPGLKLKGFTTKYILKKAFEDMLPPDILHREKHGFAFPVSESLRGSLKETAKKILFSGIHGLFNEDALESLFKRHLAGSEDLGQHIWAFLVFNLWYERNM